MDYDKLRKKLNSAKTFEDFEEVGDEILKLDEIEEDFVKELALTELTRLKINIEEFLMIHLQQDDVAEEKPEKQLLQ